MAHFGTEGDKIKKIFDEVEGLLDPGQSLSL